MKKRESENADDTKQIEDDTKQIADDTKQIGDDTKQFEDDTKQNKRRQSSWDPNSVGLGLGYFEGRSYPIVNNVHGQERRQVEKAKIGERLWIGRIESFVGQFRSLVNSIRWSSEVSIGTLEKIRFGKVEC
ncbi:putative ribonuclease T2 [Trichinella spiralis]|uniref:putative ribonuclease T2 n=1 Tax=Trichinella spiralis TaxID=6334 RepID=UPI0001EFD0FF|nr:putative ribonuclease T2 [Trichinella spiralis]